MFYSIGLDIAIIRKEAQMLTDVFREILKNQKDGETNPMRAYREMVDDYPYKVVKAYGLTKKGLPIKPRRSADKDAAQPDSTDGELVSKCPAYCNCILVTAFVTVTAFSLGLK